MSPLLLTPPSNRPDFDAVVIAEGDAAAARVLGLSLRDRARKVAERAGARRVYVLDGPAADAGLAAWRAAGDPRAVLAIWASDQVVHTPLVEPLLDRGPERGVAVGPDGAFAGAALAIGGAAIDELVTDVRGAGERWRGRDDVARVEHGRIARHVARTPAERTAARRHLEQMIHKPQDGPVTRWLYRPVSLPITRLLLHTPVTPNMVSFVVAVLGAIGVYYTAHADYDSVILGSVIILVAAYLDGCDGEIARLGLQTSRLGAWIDTVTDELTTVAYMAALGYHNYLRYDEPWVGYTVFYGLATFLLTIYFVYYYLIVVHGSANSQDYVDALEIVDGNEPGTLALRPKESEALTGIWAVAPHFLRRDFVNWGALAFAALHLTQWSYGIMLVGGTGGVLKTMVDHVKLRRQIREIGRRLA
jgi:phosphatidylglycerophosphate synthase